MAGWRPSIVARSVVPDRGTPSRNTRPWPSAPRCILSPLF